MARCEYKADVRKKKQRAKHSKSSTSSTLDQLRQKVDAALFREECAPKDGRPHWADQTIPIEFKSRKQGDIRDPFEDLLHELNKHTGEHQAPQEGALVDDPANAGDEQKRDEGEVLREEDENPYLGGCEDSMARDGRDASEGDGESSDEDCRTEGKAASTSRKGASGRKRNKRNKRSKRSKRSKAKLEPQATTRKNVRGQLNSYAELLQAIQHRVFAHMVLVVGRQCRLLRWDRAGVILTPVIDYYEDPGVLCEYLWRVSCLSDVELGFDPTAIRILFEDREWDEMDQLAQPLESDVSSKQRPLKDDELVSEPHADSSISTDSYLVFDYIREMFANSLTDPSWPRYKLRINCDPEPRDFLVGKPVSCARGALGRGTRGYIAVDCKTSHFVWLKDAWRMDYEEIEQEGTILQRLNEHVGPPRIADVPTLVCHADVPDQKTITAAWWERQNPTASSESTTSASAPPADFAQPFDLPSATRGSEDDSTQHLQKGVKRKWEDDLDSADSAPTSGPSVASDVRLECPIRRHQHYRLVTKEICKPLKEFCDALQLVKVLFDCLNSRSCETRVDSRSRVSIAHHLAATKLETRTLHRDISDSNILMFPKVILDQFGQRALNWTGILVDWEMSKPIASPTVARARQPERSVSGYYKALVIILCAYALVM